MPREPSWIGVTVEAPGEDIRCSPHEDSAFGVPTRLEFQTETPGGFGPASFTLPRPDYFAADDVRRWLYAPTRYFDRDNRTVHEGRVTGNSHVGVNEIEIQIEGFSKSLEDREDARELFIDSTLERWQEPSTQRRSNLASGGASSTNVSAETGAQDAGAAPPGITFNFQQFAASVQEHGEMAYYGNEVDLGALRYDLAASAGVDADWLDRAFLSSDDIATSVDSGTDHNQTAATNQTLSASAAGRKYAIINSAYQGAATGDNLITWHSWRNLRMLGNQGLIERGTWPEIGFYLSDIVAYLVGRWGTLLNLTSRSIEETSFVIGNAAFLDDTTPLAMLESLVLYGGNTLLPMDWGVREGREFFLASPGNYGRVWRTRIDEHAETVGAGDDAKTRYSGAKVSYQDGAGQDHTVGPPGSGAQTETTALLDSAPDNPVNFASGVDQRFRSVKMQTIQKEADAILMGQLVLAESNRRRWAGDMDFRGHIREHGGSEEPAYMIRAGDRGVVEDEPDTAERRITATTYDSERRAVKATIGQPPERFETLAARANVVLEGRL